MIMRMMIMMMMMQQQQQQCNKISNKKIKLSRLTGDDDEEIS